MPTRSRKQRLPDPNLTAISIVEAVTGEVLVPKPDAAPDTRNPAAVALGKLGGAKGGAARAKNMSKKQRSESARNAANARWKKRKQTGPSGPKTKPSV